MTNITKPNEVKREWIVLDAEGEIFGRLLTKAAILLRGKHKPCYTPNVDCGDNVIIVNAKLLLLAITKLRTNYTTATQATLAQ